MARKIQFTKMHGAGNDYIYVNTMAYDIPDPANLSIMLSRPHFSIGSDGLILIGRATAEGADFSMRIFNNDGSEAMMCGNGTRCVAKYLHDKGITDLNPIRLQTLSGIKILQLHLDTDDKVETVTVDMGQPSLQETSQFGVHNGIGKEWELTVGGHQFVGTFVSMGNPHFVVFVDDVEHLDITKYGPMLEHHEVFPQRCNIEFAEVRPDGSIRMRVWERGSGVTLACGTGACATAVAASVTGRCPRTSRIVMDGGALDIEWTADNHIMMTGPAAIAFEGEVEID